LAAITTRLEASGLAAELEAEDAPRAPREALCRVHLPDYVDRVEARIRAGARSVDSTDVNVGPDSMQAALVAAGAGLLAVDRVATGEWQSALCSVRPPGHHAERSFAMGFCLFNNAVVAARHAQERHDLQRVAILDWDVHHGNGSQHLTEEDPSILYASLHQFPHYPGTGATDERGRGPGEGSVVNCPQAAGSGEVEWLGAYEERILPAIETFAPHLILVSAGFDAHRLDPLSDTRLEAQSYAALTRGLLDVARRSGAGVVSLLEGGYSLEGLASSVEAHVAALLGS